MVTIKLKLVDEIINTEFKELNYADVQDLRNLYFKETQNTFAQRIGVSKYTITSIESKRINCSKKTYAKIRKAIIDNETKRLIESEKECINFLIMKQQLLSFMNIPPNEDYNCFLHSLRGSMEEIKNHADSFSSMDDRIAYWREITEKVYNLSKRSKTIYNNIQAQKNDV